MAVGSEAELVLRDRRVPLSEYLTKVGLYVHMEQEALVVPPGLLLKPPRHLPPYDPERLREVDWTGIDLTVESRGPARREDSVQARTLAHVGASGTWDVMLDDDGPGEIADIVALQSFAGELKSASRTASTFPAACRGRKSKTSMRSADRPRSPLVGVGVSQICSSD